MPSPGESVDLAADSDFGDSLLLQLVQLPTLTPSPGERLGGKDGSRFEILEQLGRGGMGSVYRARDDELQREVALKFLLTTARPTDDRLSARLRQEARAIAHLDHENIIRVFDVDDWRSTRPGERPIPFLVMEYLRGDSLQALLHGEPLDVHRALGIMLGVAAGLAHAHERSIVHRDLKPSNVFLTTDGKVKLLDFGLAHLTGTVLVPEMAKAGTPPYMAPEQWGGEPSAARTDVWAAGVMLFQMVAGELPFPGARLEELRARVTSAEPMPSLRERRPELPPELAQLVAAALSKDPARRLPSAAELLARLRELYGRLEGERKQLPVEVQQRQVTLLCCQLTGVSDRLDPEELAELQATFHRECAERVRASGGTVTSSVGNESLACFGYPRAHEEDSADAVRAGLRLVEELRTALAPVSPRAAVRVGIHTGMVMLADGAEPASSMQGEAPTVASWLARRAAPGTVVMSDATRSLGVRGAFRTAPLGTASFEGMAGPEQLSLYRALHPRRIRSRFARAFGAGALTPLVNRERELSQLRSLWEGAQRGQGACALLRGEAGIGKSRLIQEVKTQGALAPSAWVRSQCWEQLRNSAFHPVIDSLRRSLELRDGDSPEQRLRKLEARFASLGPAKLALVAAVLSLPVPAGAPAPALPPRRQREQTLEVLRDVILGAADEQPRLLVVEDLHWADPSTLQLLDMVVSQLRDTRIFLLLSARPEFDPAWRPRPWFHQLPLERLSPELTSVLIRRAARERPLPAAAVDQLVAKTDGIPLFVEEMTRMVVERAGPGGVTAEALPTSIPVTLHELLLARLDQLPAGQKALAQLAAVVGRRVPRAMLAASAGRGDAELQRDLEDLVDAGLLAREEDASEPTYQFRHALFQEAAYQSLPRARRRQRHARLAQTLAERFPALVEEHPELLAHHHTEAGAPEPAIRLWIKAGLSASRRYAHVEAIAHLRRALRLIAALPESPKRAQQELPVLISAGYSMWEVHGLEDPELERTFGRAEELMRQVWDALPRLDLTYWGPFAYLFGRAEFQRAHELAERLVSLGQRLDDPELRAQGHRSLALVLTTWGRFEEALPHVEQALADSRCELEQHRALAMKHLVEPAAGALALAAVVHQLLGHPRRAADCARQALELAEQIGHPHTTLYTRFLVSRFYQLSREPALALACAERAVAMAREHRIRIWLAQTLSVQAWAQAQLGAREEGLALAEESLAVWRRSGIKSDLTFALGIRAELQLGQGRLSEGLASVEEALEVMAATGERTYEAELRRLQGELSQRAGAPEAALGSFAQALEVARRQRALAFEVRATASASRLLVALGRGEQALERMEELSRRVDLEVDTPDCVEALRLLRGLQAESGGAAPSQPH